MMAPGTGQPPRGMPQMMAPQGLTWASLRSSAWCSAAAQGGGWAVSQNASPA